MFPDSVTIDCGLKGEESVKKKRRNVAATEVPAQ